MRDDLEGMSHEESIEWYMARDGQQFRSLSDTEMRKFNELGYLLRTDLVWRKGFGDWRQAGAIFEIARREKG